MSYNEDIAPYIPSRPRPRKVSVGWIIFDPTTETKVRRSVNSLYRQRQSARVYASQKVAERYLEQDAIAKEVFVDVFDGSSG